VAEGLGHLVDVILDGGRCRVGVESTVLSLLSSPATILRPGGLTAEALGQVLGHRVEVEVRGSRPLAPGQLDKHYATRTPLHLLDGGAAARPPQRGRVGLLAFSSAPAHHSYAAVEVLAPDGQTTTAAANLFASMRRLDAAELDLILAEPCPRDGLGLAILDRLRRAEWAE
jgi:L-threonylcarbamoyladenylate synthase